MPAGTQKIAGDLPVFEEQQPLGRPWDDRRRDRHLRGPEHLGRIPEAQRWPSRVAIVPIDVRQKRLVRQHLRADERVDHMGGYVAVREPPSFEESPPKVDNADPVSL